MSETTLVVRIGNLSQVVTTKNGRLEIEIFDHDPEPHESVQEEKPFFLPKKRKRRKRSI